ncbi:MAG: hypothetical protein IT378_13355 [Sandaracinaceae bacterium]|nr:hypothetical protein [Sandaracinaceae bacterium]
MGESPGVRTAPPERLELALALGTIGGATIFLFWPLFWGVLAGRPPFFEWDVPEQYWPDLVTLCRSVHSLELPYWSPYDHAGYPYYADPQAAPYHPGGWAICALAGPSPSLGWASARVVLGFALAGSFALLFLRRLDIGWSGAVLGAVFFEAAPFMRHNWELNLTFALAHLPLALWAADRLAVERGWRDAIVFALSIGLATWAGSPPALWLTSSLCAVYLVFRAAQQLRLHRRVALRELARAVPLAILLAAALCAVVLVPTSGLAGRSVQQDHSLSSIADGALRLEQLVALVWPQPGNHLYPGLLVLALSAIGALRARDATRWLWLAIVLFAILMSLGAGTPLFRVAFELVPGVSRFRLPHRYEAWLGPALAVLCALGLGKLAERRYAPIVFGRLRRQALALFAFGVVALLLAPGLGPGLFAIAVAIVLVLYTLPARFGAGSALAGALLSAVLLADVGQSLPSDRHLRFGTPPAEAPGQDAILAHAPGTGSAWRYHDEHALSCRSGTRLRRRDLRGYQDPLLLKSYERVMDALGAHPALAMQYNVRFVLSGPHFLHGWDRHYLPPPSELASIGTEVFRDARGRHVIELPRALPFAYFVPASEVERAPDRSAALARTIALAPSAIAILDGESDPPAARLAASGRALAAPASISQTHLRLSSDAVDLAIRAPSDGVVVVNETYYPGWRAWVDGREAPVFRANGLVRAVPVSRGARALAMRFEPADGVWLRRLWGFALVLCAAGLILDGVLRLRARRAAGRRTAERAAAGAKAA